MPLVHLANMSIFEEKRDFVQGFYKKKRLKLLIPLGKLFLQTLVAPHKNIRAKYWETTKLFKKLQDLGPLLRSEGRPSYFEWSAEGRVEHQKLNQTAT